MKFFKTLLTLLCIISLSSCVSSKKILYFQDGTTPVTTETLQVFEPKIQTGDLLSINISAMNAEAALPFNLYETPIIGNYATNLKPLDYLVNAQGDINFPVLGTLKVAGMTTLELTSSLTEQLIKYLKEPIVNIRIVNFKVSVLGDVLRPGAFNVANERITIVEALGLAGDLTIQANRSTVILMREAEGERKFISIDLTNKDLFKSSYYYMAQNDVLYVAPNKTKINSSGVGTNTGIIISSLSLLITLVAIIIK